MTFFGIELRRPSFNEVTAATVMAVGLWVAVIGLAQVSGHALQARDAGERRRLAEEGKAPDGHGCAFLTGLAATCGVPGRIGRRREENAKATWPGDPGR